MLKKLISVLLFAFFCFLVVELSYRVYAVGTVAFNPVRFNSLRALTQTDLIEASEYPEVFYQLKPNLDAWYAGRRFTTNSYGLADQEYALQKPEGVFRVAVLGSSWTMATGVEQQEAYHAVMEQRLNEEYPGRKFEFINFGVELYGLREIVGNLRHRVMAWQPDLILVSITSFTAYVEWQPPGSGEVLSGNTRNPFFESYVLRVLDARLKLGIFADNSNLRPTVGNGSVDLYRQQIRRAFEEISALSHAAGIPAAIMWLSYGKPGGTLGSMMDAAADELDVTYIKAYKRISGTAAITKTRQVSRFDNHPNAHAHRLIADELIEEFKRDHLLPGVE